MEVCAVGVGALVHSVRSKVVRSLPGGFPNMHDVNG